MRRHSRRPTACLLACAGAATLLIPSVQPAHAEPTLAPTTHVSGVSIPWDVTWVGDLMLYTLRSGQVWSQRGTAPQQRVTINGFPTTYATGEGGLLGIVAAPDAATSRRFYTCGAVRGGNGQPLDVRVLRWQLDTGSDMSASSAGAPVVTGLPLNSSGRHSGCRLRFGSDGKLYVGTGDAAVGANPQNLNSLGGKVLRVNPDGSIPADNPYAGQGGNAARIWTYGHRNVQGLALRPGTTQLWTAEHGPTRDDEINLLARAGNYGWDPVPGYNESVPMTDTTKFPAARRAVWSSGSPTVATSGLTFLNGPAWGRWQGAMAVGLLKDRGILIVTLNPGGQLARTERLPAADGYGRIRTVQSKPDGTLYFTTSNGSGGDRIVRLTPSPARALPPYTPGLDVSPIGVAAARTGNTLYLFGRSPAGSLQYRRSNNNGTTWAGWTSTNISSTSAPAVTSSAPGRIDVFSRNSAGNVVHTWFNDGIQGGQANLGGFITAAPAAVSRGDGTLDVFVRGSGSYGAVRNRFANGQWTGWQQLGGIFTSALGASINRSTGDITITGRGTNAIAYTRTVTATSNGSGWSRAGITLWSARALADTANGSGLVGVSSGSDSNAVVDRGPLVMGVNALYNSAPAVVTRADGTWIMFGRSSNSGAWLYDARPGGYRNVNLGGVLG
jgi:glucose/arabinose dehydrogenase